MCFGFQLNWAYAIIRIQRIYPPLHSKTQIVDLVPVVQPNPTREAQAKKRRGRAFIPFLCNIKAFLSLLLWMITPPIQFFEITAGGNAPDNDFTHSTFVWKLRLVPIMLVNVIPVYFIKFMNRSVWLFQLRCFRFFFFPQPKQNKTNPKAINNNTEAYWGSIIGWMDGKSSIKPKPR